MAHAGKVLLKIVANRLGYFCEEAPILPKEQCGIRPQHSTTAMIFIVRRLNELLIGRANDISLEVCFIGLAKRIRIYRSCATMLSTCPFWNFISTIKVIRIFHNVLWALVQLDDSDVSAWVNVYQGFRQGCVLSPLLFNISFAAIILVVLQRFVEEPMMVSGLVYLDDAPKSKDGRPREEGKLEMVRRAVQGILYADNARTVSTSPRGLIRMIDVVVVAYQEFGLTVSEKKTDSMHLWSDPRSASNTLQIEALGLPTRTRTPPRRLGVASASLGRVSQHIIPTCTADGMPGCHSRL